MNDIIGHQYIGGARSAAGTIPLQAMTPALVKRCPFHSAKPAPTKSTPQRKPPLPPTLPFVTCRRVGVRSF